MQPYQDSLEHLREEFTRLDVLLQRALVLERQSNTAQTPDDWRGLVITEPEIEALAQTQDFFGTRWQQAQKMQSVLRPYDEKLDRWRTRIDERRRRTTDVALALPRLARAFDLSLAEIDLLLIALAPELEASYETLYAYLQNDVTRRRPSVDLALNLICRTEREKLQARQLFTPTAPLLRHRLLELGEETHDRAPSLLRKTLRPEEAVIRFLVQSNPASAPESLPIATPALSAALQETLQNLAAALSATTATDIVIRFVGSHVNVQRAAAAALAGYLRQPLLYATLSPTEDATAQLALHRRDAALQQALLAVELTAPSDGDTTRQQAEAALWRGLQAMQTPVLLFGPGVALKEIPAQIKLWQVSLADPGFTARRQSWEAVLNGRAATVDTARLADTFQFSGGRIQQTCELAQGLASLRAATTPNTQDMLDAGRILTTPNLGHYAQAITPRYEWDDLILPAERTQQLRRVAAWMKYRRQVHHTWGFEQKLVRGKGLNALFTGPSGTGKTMAAEVLAKELSLDLYQIDLSSVVSKYIGETEKNLEVIFREAQQSQVILFFDEADALFGKRTEVKDAHDRYANIEVNFLLQRVEQYEGIVILATNLQRNLDEAFLRRLHEVVEFPLPDDELRQRIWRKHLPTQAPQAEDIDFNFLARQFKFTGGSIKNVTLTAAFLAAEAGRPIGMRHLILAVKAELQKQGKLCVKSDFGPYYDWLQACA